jgi:hypothetical protein
MFMPSGAPKLVRKTTSDSKKLKAIADLLGVKDAGGLKSAKVELSYGEGESGGGSKGGSKGAAKGGAKKTAAKKR